MARQVVAQPKEAVEVQTGTNYVNKIQINRELGVGGRALASLSMARIIKEPGKYWISTESEKVSKDTYRGLPTESGCFRDNKDGTFTKLKNRTDATYENAIFVSAEAVVEAALRPSMPVILLVEQGVYCRLGVDSGEVFGYTDARVTIAPESAKVLRVGEDEVLEVTLPDGKTMQIDATAAIAVKRQ